MNYRLIINQLGLLQVVLSIILLLMAAGFFAIELALHHTVDAQARGALMLTGGIGMAIGLAAWFFTRSPSQHVGRRDAILLVGMTWALGAAFSALPYLFWAMLSEDVAADHPFHSFTDCYFEAMSGLTTTGATVLTDIEAVPRSLLLWRAMTQWLGGLGIVVLFVAVLPALGTSARKMFSAESSGVTKHGLMPQIRDTARLLWYIYMSLTVVQIVLLRVAGMEWFDSVCHTFASLATGGFSTKNASIAAFESPAIELILVMFMMLGGVSFGLYYQAMRGRFKSVYKDSELRLYLALIVFGTAMMAALLYGKGITTVDGQVHNGTVFNSIRNALFTVVSMMTTTGFTTAEFDLWHPLAQFVLFLLVIAGGCAGSTSGGVKTIRVWIVLKTLYVHIERTFRPSVIRTIRIGASPISEDVCLATLAFIAAYFITMLACTMGILGIEGPERIDLVSALTGVLSCISNTGPGLGKFGAEENFGWVSGASKWVFSFAMLVGRLEVFTILVLFAPRFWRNR